MLLKSSSRPLARSCARCTCRCLRALAPLPSPSPAHHQRSPPISGPRYYATVQDARRSDGSIPEWPRTAHPTPYDIFGMTKNAPYTKRRFYQLVKLYHPDTHEHNTKHTSPSSHSSGSSVSSATRLERYRLVVAANDLLSDPAKRRLYDTHGIGWVDSHHSPSLRESDRTWRHQPGNAAGNATWEDWERWRDAQSGRNGKAEPLYMSNGVFAALVVMMCMMGALAQSNRAEHMGTNYVEFMDGKHTAISDDMRRQHRATAGLSKDERVDSFLRDRENVAYVYFPKKYDGQQPDRPA